MAASSVNGGDAIGGYPTEAFLSADSTSALQCSIYFDVARDPRRCGNEHLYCHSCIAVWLITHSTCPTCQTALTTETLSVARFAASVLADLGVRCLSCCSDGPTAASVSVPVPPKCPISLDEEPTFTSWPLSLQALSWEKHKASMSQYTIDLEEYDKLCEMRSNKTKEINAMSQEDKAAPAPISCVWSGKLSELDTHTLQCSHIVVPCTCQGCEERMPRGELAIHVTVCEHRAETCAYGCGADVTVSLMEAHMESLCPCRPVLCPNACGVTLPLNELQAHRDESCPLEHVACPYAASLACAHRCARCDMAAHSADVQAHFASVVAKVQQLETKVQNLETENNQLKQSIGWVSDTCTWEVECYEGGSKMGNAYSSTLLLFLTHFYPLTHSSTLSLSFTQYLVL
jgi:hypothetical protein